MSMAGAYAHQWAVDEVDDAELDAVLDRIGDVYRAAERAGHAEPLARGRIKVEKALEAAVPLAKVHLARHARYYRLFVSSTPSRPTPQSMRPVQADEIPDELAGKFCWARAYARHEARADALEDIGDLMAKLNPATAAHIREQLVEQGYDPAEIAAALTADDPPKPERKAVKAAVRDKLAGERKPDGLDAGPYAILDDGRRVRAAARGESFAQICGIPEPREDGEDHALGRAVVAMVTGRSEIAPRMAMDTQTDPDGGFWVSTAVSGRFIDLARARSVLTDAGALTLPIAGPTRVTKVTSDPTAGWHSELEALTDASVGLGAVELRPKTIGAVVDASVELMEDAPDAPARIEQVLALATAEQLDRALFRGIDGDHPFTGVLDDPNVNITDLNAAAVTDFDDLVDAITDIRTANGEPNVSIMAPRTAGEYQKLKEATTNAPLAMPADVAALRRLISNQLPTDQGGGSNESAVIVGDFGATGAWVILGVRSRLRVEVSREAGDAFENLGVKIRCWGRFDLAIGRPTHLSRIDGIIPPS